MLRSHQGITLPSLSQSAQHLSAQRTHGFPGCTLGSKAEDPSAPQTGATGGNCLGCWWSRRCPQGQQMGEGGLRFRQEARAEGEGPRRGPHARMGQPGWRVTDHPSPSPTSVHLPFALLQGDEMTLQAPSSGMCTPPGAPHHGASPSERQPPATPASARTLKPPLTWPLLGARCGEELKPDPLPGEP